MSFKTGLTVSALQYEYQVADYSGFSRLRLREPDDLRALLRLYKLSSLAKKLGAVTFKTLKVSKRILKSIQNRAESQCKAATTGVM